MNRRLLVSAALVASSLLGLALNATEASAAGKPQYYVALGDSYAEGYQPGFTDNSETLRGYVNQVAGLVKAKNWTLENFGCGGATSHSILYTTGCSALATNGVSYPTTTQAQAAINFINAHKGQIALITISIGGNDFDACINDADPVTCVSNNMPVMEGNVALLANQLRAAAGPTTPMIATTYPDVVLGAMVGNNPNNTLATESTLAFSLIINPDLLAAYTTSRTSFIDITAATGAYTPLSQTTTLAPYGTVPVAVAQVCTLTWFCEKRDIHPKDAGYTFIAQQVANRYTSIIKTKKTGAPKGVSDSFTYSVASPSSFDPLANDTVKSGDHLIASTLRLCVGKAKAPKCSATSVTVANKGTFSVDPATAKVTFTPVSGFTGTVPAVGYQAADIFGQVASSTLSVTVSA